jgi:hypothetical protein
MCHPYRFYATSHRGSPRCGFFVSISVQVITRTTFRETSTHSHDVHMHLFVFQIYGAATIAAILDKSLDFDFDRTSRGALLHNVGWSPQNCAVRRLSAAQALGYKPIKIANSTSIQYGTHSL